MGTTNRNWFYSVLVLILLVVLWKFVTLLFKLPIHVLPPPEVIFVKFIALVSDSIIQTNLLATLVEIGIGFSVGLVVGLIVGYILAKSELVEKVLSPYILVFQTAPKISLAPLFVLWFGLGILSKVVLISLVTLFPVMINMIVGIRSTERNYYDLLIILQAKPWQRMLKVEMMHALPNLLAGLRIAMVLSITAAVIGEMMGSKQGLGFLLILGNEMYDIPLLLNVILVISLVSYLLDLMMQMLQKKLLSWHVSMLK